jgi:hypothetical protein
VTQQILLGCKVLTSYNFCLLKEEDNKKSNCLHEPFIWQPDMGLKLRDTSDTFTARAGCFSSPQVAIREGNKEVLYTAYKPAHQAWVSPVRLTDKTRDCNKFKVKINNKGYFVIIWEEIYRKQISIYHLAKALFAKT